MRSVVPNRTNAFVISSAIEFVTCPTVLARVRVTRAHNRNFAYEFVQGSPTACVPLFLVDVTTFAGFVPRFVVFVDGDFVPVVGYWR